MANEFQEKVLLITGASGTIGRALTNHFLALDAIVCAQVNTGALEAHPKLHIFPIDFKSTDAARKMVESSIEAAGKIDFLINNTANQEGFPFAAITAEHADNVFRVNVSIPAELIALAAKTKVKVCLNISSIAANTARPGHAIDGASKAALDSLTRSAGQELTPMRTLGLRLGLVGKVGIDQERARDVNSWKQAAPLKRYATADEVAGVVEFLLSTANAWATGLPMILMVELQQKPTGNN